MSNKGRSKRFVNLSSLFPVQQLETKMHMFGWPVLTMCNDMHHSLIQIIIYVITRRSFRSPTPFLFVNYLHLFCFHAEKFLKLKIVHTSPSKLKWDCVCFPPNSLMTQSNSYCIYLRLWARERQENKFVKVRFRKLLIIDAPTYFIISIFASPFRI